MTASTTELVVRFDAARLGRATRTPQGFLRAPARITRTGVLIYRRADGSERRELRRPEQVFSPASLATLSDAPVTDLHPKVMVSPDNAREFSVGHVSQSSVRADGDKFVEAQIVITDAAMIRAVEGGKRREVSCGYHCKTLEQPGTWNGEHYDAEQVDIVYNHVGVGPANWARAGSECAVRLDGGDALSVDTIEAPEERDQPVDDNTHKDSAERDALQAKVDAASAERDALKTERDALQAKVDAMAAELQELKDAGATADPKRRDAADEIAELKDALAEAQDPERNAAAVRARAALIVQARGVLSDYRFDNKTEREIHEAVLQKLDPRFDGSGKDDAYVRGRFDQALEGHDSDDDFDNARRATSPGAGSQGARRDSFDYRKSVPPAWQQPLAVHRKD